MKYILIALLSVSFLYAAKVVQVDEKYQQSQKCKSCHLPIVKEWKASWHAKSHFKNDEYFRATTKYVSKKTRKSLNSVKVQCATCHNPRISVTSTDEDYEIDAIMGLDGDSEVNKALESDAIGEGINCVVCHNIDKINHSAPASKRGINRVEWTKSGTMSGPYNDAKSPYHKVVARDFMGKKSDQLCFVCHANDRSASGLVFTNMQKEYKKGQKGCVDCHMGPKEMGIASTLRIDNGKPRKREIRSHGFIGGHVDSMWRDALSLKLKSKGKNVLVEIDNPQPHNIPSGFGSREIIVDLVYKNGSKVIESKTISLTRHYVRKKGKPSVAHMAISQTKDISIPAKGKRVLKVAKVKGASSVEVTLSYRLVNDEVRNLLKLKDALWARKSFIAKKSLKLK